MVQNKLKIGLLIDTSLDLPDGVQQYVLQLGIWLTNQGHEVHYLTSGSERPDLTNLHSLSRSIHVRFNGNRLSIPIGNSRQKLTAFMQAEMFEVLHVQTPHHPWLAQRLIVGAGPRTAVVATFHILPYSRLTALATRLLGWWLRPSLRRIDQLLAVSPAAADFCYQSFGRPPQVLPNVVDYQLYHGAKPFERYQDDTLTILFVGRLVPRKGCLTLLQAINLLTTTYPNLPDFRVLICGRGVMERTLQQYVQDHNLSSVVDFAGFVDEADKPRYYASADISVFPSSGGESFGIVLLEAMASGKSVVLAGDNPGYRSVMSPQPDLLFEADNAQLLAQKIYTYMTDINARQPMRQWAEQYSRQFDIETVGPQLEAIYAQALRKRQRPAIIEP